MSDRSEPGSSPARPPRLALDPPSTPLAIITEALVDAALAHSRTSPRRRVIQPFHRSEADSLHRMFNAVQPDSYVRPHRHVDPPKAEAWLLLRGAAAFFLFDDAGEITAIEHLRAGSDRFGIDLVPGIWHGFIALEPDTVFYEVKPGPYVQATDKSFAPWAPAEGHPDAGAYLARLHALAARGRDAR